MYVGTKKTDIDIFGTTSIGRLLHLCLVSEIYFVNQVNNAMKLSNSVTEIGIVYANTQIVSFSNESDTH
jgi:hypothetical protein